MCQCLWFKDINFHPALLILLRKQGSANLLEELSDGAGINGGLRQGLVNAREELHHCFHGDVADNLLRLLAPVERVGAGHPGNALVLQQTGN